MCAFGHATGRCQGRSFYLRQKARHGASFRVAGLRRRGASEFPEFRESGGVSFISCFFLGPLSRFGPVSRVPVTPPTGNGRDYDGVFRKGCALRAGLRAKNSLTPPLLLGSWLDEACNAVGETGCSSRIAVGLCRIHPMMSACVNQHGTRIQRQLSGHRTCVDSAPPTS